MRYLLGALAVIWLADGLALLLAPQQVVALVKDAMARSPWVVRAEILAAVLGLLLLMAAPELWLTGLWSSMGVLMMLKGLFLAGGPDPWRQRVLAWCLDREAIDYRLGGLALCALSALLFSALGRLPPG